MFEGESGGGHNGVPLTHIECREQCDKFGRNGSKIHEQTLHSFTHVSAVVSAASVMAVPLLRSKVGHICPAE